MSRSISIVMPVRNAERTLADTVQHLLEVLPDVTENFDVLVVDQGSTDATRDVADEMARQYPQLRVARNDDTAAREMAGRSAIKLTDTEMVYVGAGQRRLRPSQLRRLLETNDKRVANSEAIRLADDN